jgi:hypothetical protein
MAGSSMVFTYDVGVEGGEALRDRVRKVTATWTSDNSSGAVTGVTQKMVGRLVKAVTVPGAGGVQPSDNYTVTITETINGNNVLGETDTTLASNQSHSSVTETYFLQKNAVPAGVGVHPIVCDQLTIAVSGAGNSKQGSITLYIEV